MSLGLQTQIRPRSSRRPECFHLSLACTPLSTLVEQFGKGLPSSGQRPFCPCLPSGQFCAGEATSGGGPRAQNPLPGEGPPPAEPRGKLEAQGAWGLRRRAGRQRARTGRRAPDPALALTSPISPPQAKLNISVRALAFSAPNLQVALETGGWGGAGGQQREGGGGPADLGCHLLCPVPREVEGWVGRTGVGEQIPEDHCRGRCDLRA